MCNPPSESGERPETLGAEERERISARWRLVTESPHAYLPVMWSAAEDILALLSALGQAEAERDEAREMFDRSNRLATRAALEAGNDVSVWRERALAAEAALAGARRDALEEAAGIADRYREKWTTRPPTAFLPPDIARMCATEIGLAVRALAGSAGEPTNG